MDTDPRELFTELYADIQADLHGMMRKVDESLRERFAGCPVEDIRDPAEHAFGDIGLHLSDEQLDDYAASVSTGRAFSFVLE
jgi:hypothetical protein